MAKFYYRLPPCPSYDFMGIEAWLEHMAQKGMHLDQNGHVFHLFQFQKCTPKAVKFRLEANPRQSPLDIRPPDEPDADALALNREFGWEYWGPYREFHIYRSEDPNPRELNTDPAVQAMSLDAVRTRTGFFTGFLFFTLAGILLGFLGTPVLSHMQENGGDVQKALRCLLAVIFSLLGAAYLLRERKNGKISLLLSKCCMLFLYFGFVTIAYRSARSMTPLLDILDRGWLWWLAFCGVYISCLLCGLLPYLHIRKLQKKLRRGQMPERTFTRAAWLRRLELLPFLMLLLLNIAAAAGGRPGNVTSLTDFQGSLPFPTMTDMAPSWEYIPRDSHGQNFIRSWQDILSPVNYDWRETAWLDAPDGSRYAGTLSITYHEAANEAIARRLVAEYTGATRSEPTLIPAGILPDALDDLAVFPGIHPTILLRKENIVICAYCSVQSWGDHTPLYPLWIQQAAASLSRKEAIS